MKLNHIAIIGFSFIISCVEPFEYEALDTERVLVVDGLLTDEQKAHEVILSYTYPIDTFYFTPISGATVWIESGSGTIEQLTETVQGTYLTSPGFVGVAGESYQLKIRTADDREFASSPQMLIASPKIDSVYGAYVSIPLDDNVGFSNGIQFFVDTDVAGSEASRFRYEWEETYEVRVPYPSFFYWSLPDTALFPRDESIEICFQGDTSKTLILTSSTALTSQRITQYPIRFVDEQTLRLSYKYAINVKQYAINSATYSYYKRLKENNESAGSLFDKQKGPISGNISSTTNPDEFVLGNFEVSGVVQQLRFFSAREFIDDGFQIGRFPGCDPNQTVDSIAIDDVETFFLSGQGQSKGVFLLTAPPIFAVIFPEACTDCRFHGTIVKPDYWD